MTWAVTASVAFWFGTNSVADMRDAPCFGLADAGQGVSDEQIHHAPSTERGLDEHHAWRLRPDLADLGGERTAGSRGERRERVLRRLRARRRRRARPRSRRTWGRCRGSRRHRRPQGARARPPRARPSRRTTPARARSAPTRRRRGSRRAGSGARGRRRRAAMSTAGHSERVSETTGASSSNSPRASITAVPCSPIGPETRMRSPGRSEPGESDARGSMRPSPVVVTYIESHLPALDDLRVARDDLDSGGARRRGDRLDLGAQVVGREALLEHERERQRERARAGHREVVDRAVDGELADRAAGEADRLDDEAVGRHARGRRSRRRRRARAARRRRRPARRGRSRASASPCRRRRAPS